MPENYTQKDPGHLDIDAVSAFVDRDLGPDDLAMISFHLSNCPACDREVLEIRTTVFLLAGLPQYEPRRSFCLGQEHARASRRREQSRESQPWSGANALTGQPGGAIAQPAGVSRGGWLSGLHVAAVVVGALLLLVTASDLTGFVADPPSPLQLAAPTAAAGITPPQAAMPAEAPQAAQVAPPVADAVSEAEPSSGMVSAFQEAPAALRGTTDRDSASEEMPEAENLAQPAPRLMATVAGAAAVTQAIPTPGAASAPSGAGSAERVGASDGAVSGEQPSRMRIVQLALGLLLAWLIVSIAGMRWVRRLR